MKIPQGLHSRRRAALLAVLALTISASALSASGLNWWCYNGTCCEMNGQTVTTNCEFGCINENGLNLSLQVLMGCADQ